MRHSRLTLTIILTAILTIVASSQTSVSQEQIAPPPLKSDIWKLRAESITSTLLREIPKVENLEKATIYAHLGNIWWKHDRTRAESWYEKSVDSIAYYPLTDQKINIENFYLATSEVLQLIAERVPKQSDRLLKIISEADQLRDKNKASNPEILIEFACLIAKHNPARAHQLGVTAFQIGEPQNFYRLYWQLRRYSPELANQYVGLAMATAKQSPTPQIFSSIKSAVFPELTGAGNSPDRSSSDQIKRAVLNLFADQLLQSNARSIANLEISCEADARIVSSLQSQYAALLSHREQQVAQPVSRCTEKLTDAERSFSAVGINAIKTGTIEELLKLADQAGSNSGLRAHYFYRAIALAHEKEKFQTGLDILEKMTKEERGTDPGFGDELRVLLASGLAYQKYRAGDVSGADRTLDALPENERVLGKIVFVQRFNADDDDDARDFCLQMLKEAGSQLERSEKPFDDKAEFAFLIVGQLSRFGAHDRAMDSLKELFVAMNRSAKRYRLTIARTTSTITPEFLEAQENSLLSAALTISENNSRTNVMIGLLKVAVDHHSKLLAAESKDLQSRN